MNVVVLGAGGLLGRHVVEELRREQSAEVTALATLPAPSTLAR